MKAKKEQTVKEANKMVQDLKIEVKAIKNKLREFWK